MSAVPSLDASSATIISELGVARANALSIEARMT